MIRGGFFKPMKLSLVLSAALLIAAHQPQIAFAGQGDTTSAAVYKQSPEPIQVEVVRYDWRDGKRDRKVPVKIYFPKSASGPFPVIIFSHGLGGSRENYEYLGRHWASHGYVSVHLQHLGSDDAVWKNGAGMGRMEAMRKAAANPRNAINRPLDVSFAIDQLEKLNQEKSPFQKRLDLERIGVAGHSFGAFTVLATIGQTFLPRSAGESRMADPRVKAGIAMSAPVGIDRGHFDQAFAGVKVPCFHMTGTRDFSPIGDTRPEDRRVPFDHISGADQFLITFKDGDHMIFSGRGPVRIGAEKDEHFQKLICASSTAFWDAYLRGDAKAKQWLMQDFERVLGGDGVFEKKEGKPVSDPEKR